MKQKIIAEIRQLSKIIGPYAENIALIIAQAIAILAIVLCILLPKSELGILTAVIAVVLLVSLYTRAKPPEGKHEKETNL